MTQNVSIVEISWINGTIRGICENKKSDTSLVFIHWFERFWLEMKFKNLTSSLDYNRIYFDQPWIGISEWDYSKHTLDTLTQNLIEIIKYTQNELSQNIILVGHSLGCLLGLHYMSKLGNHRNSKMIMIAPALDQHTLNRFRFACSKYKTKEVTIERANWKDYYKEEDYLTEKLRKPSFSKYNEIESNYFASMEWVNGETQLALLDNKNIMTILWQKDSTVPLSSLELSLYKNHLIIEGGDHDMQTKKNATEIAKSIKNFIG